MEILLIIVILSFIAAANIFFQVIDLLMKVSFRRAVSVIMVAGSMSSAIGFVHKVGGEVLDYWFPFYLLMIAIGAICGYKTGKLRKKWEEGGFELQEHDVL